jgi:broad specificity phosphatase PhoE
LVGTLAPCYTLPCSGVLGKDATRCTGWGIKAAFGRKSPQLAMGKSNEIRVLFVRTGETEWESAGRIAGATDVPLSPAGLAAAAQTVSELQGVELGTIFCSADEASIATANELAKVTGGKVKPIDDLGEVNLGLWEGMLARELEDKCPRAYRQWLEDPCLVHVPEGEGLDEARERLVETLGRALDKVRWGNGSIGVVLRPMAMALIGCALADASTSSLWTMMKTGPAADWRTLQRGALRHSGMQARAGT